MKRIVQVKPEIKMAFEAKVAECIRLAREKSGKDIPIFPLVFRQMGNRAGVCSISYIQPTELYINPDYFKNHYDDQLNDTVPHEVAHGVVHELWPEPMLRRKGQRLERHGDKWNMVMGWFGIKNPRTTHSYDMEGVATRRKTARPFNYVCKCGYPHKLTLRLHEKVQRDGKHRLCKRCRTKLIYERQVGKPTPVVKLEVEKVSPKVTLITVLPPKPVRPATHRMVTRFVNGILENVRIPLTTEKIAI